MKYKLKIKNTVTGTIICSDFLKDRLTGIRFAITYINQHISLYGPELAQLSLRLFNDNEKCVWGMDVGNDVIQDFN
ncbi:hypothetical protein LCGC14_2529620 [marine sediment metagenome]|uniref:Uncharacterized protein n=1 Tax=marine sediment metagenome TaxID=412755 RepID=A0A0F9DM33_9ZZZZ